MKIIEQKTVPALRFPEFSGEWRKAKFNKLFNISAGGDISKEHVCKYRTDDFRYPIFANAEKNKGFYGYSDIYKVSPEVITVAGRGVNIGIAHARKEKFVPIVRLLVLKPKVDASVEFFEQAINQMHVFVESTGVPQLTAPQISSYKICYTEYIEQQKIAVFLTSVDAKIEQLGKKKALLEQYKKGMMQKLFNQELCFKDEQGNDFQDWEEKQFGEVVKSYRLGGNYSNSEETTEAPLIKMGNIGRGNIVLKKIEYIKQSETIEDIDLIQYGNLFFNTRNTLDLVGKVAIWRDELQTAYYNSNLMRISFDNNFFMNYFMNSHEGLKKLRRIATGTTSVAAIYTKDLLKVWLPIPEIKEQQKIADFLSAIDKKIELVGTEIEKAQTFKKGLLQKMFI